MTEIWKPVTGYEMYEVSNTGKIRRNNKLLNPSLTSKGYYTISLSKNGKVTKHRLHRLVAEAFIPNPYNKPSVDHKDANRQNNVVSNLQWVSAKENAHNPIYRLSTFKMIIQHTGNYLNYHNIFNSIREAEYYTGIEHSGISKCALGKNLSAGGYKWTYADDVNTMGSLPVVGRLTKKLNDIFA